MAWEKKHRPLGPGDVVLFHSGYSDKYYKPLPEGRRFAADPVDGQGARLARPRPRLHGVPGQPQGDDAGHRQHEHGAAARPGRADALRRAEARHDLDRERHRPGGLPPTGAFYCMLGPKHAGSAYSEGRAFAVVGDPLARRLIDSARKKNVVDLSVAPGRRPARRRGPAAAWATTASPTCRIRFGLNPNTKTRLRHAHAGQPRRHAPGAARLRPAAATASTTRNYAPEVREWLAEYEKKYGPRGTSDVTTEKVPLSQTCGPARVIDVTHLARHAPTGRAGPPRRRSRRPTSGTTRSSTAS